PWQESARRWRRRRRGQSPWALRFRSKERRRSTDPRRAPARLRREGWRRSDLSSVKPWMRAAIVSDRRRDVKARGCGWTIAAPRCERDQRAAFYSFSLNQAGSLERVG